MCDKASRHAAAANLFFELLQNKVLVPGRIKLITIQDCIAVALRTFLHTNSETK